MPVLSANDLTVRFLTRGGVVRAVERVSLDVDEGEIVGLVGESGCGKSVLCLAVMGLLARPPASIERGSVLFDGMDLVRADAAAVRSLRGRRMSMIFQDPLTGLNPYMRIGDQVTEPLRARGKIDKKEVRDRGRAALAEAGLPDPARLMARWPHELSGGMRQRVMIAMALIGRPALLFADEPTTALDVTVQAQILALLKRLQRDLHTSVVFVSHDLGVVGELCDRVMVMYAGRIVETASATELFARPLHPYTHALGRASPALASKGRSLYAIPGAPPDLLQEIAGCPFMPRCERAMPACAQAPMALDEVAPGHWSACIRARETA
jgi:oligopeptide/dipeptide ABC transporter ATP-binding protein